jgi:hypothetical protein
MMKLTIPFMSLITVLGTAAGAGGSWMATKEQIKSIANESSENKAEIRRLNDERESQALNTEKLNTKVEKLNTSMEYTVRALERLEQKLGTNR